MRSTPPHTRHPASPVALFLAAFACMLVFGTVLALPGTGLGLASVRARLGISLAEQGEMILLLFAGLSVATLVAGTLVDRFGTQRVLAGSTGLVAAGLLLFASAREAAMTGAAMLTLGVGGAGINTAANVLVSDVYGSARGRMLNRLALAAGAGGLLLPVLSASTQGAVPITTLGLLGAGIAGAAALWTMWLPFSPVRVHAPIDATTVWRIGRLPGLWIFGVLLLLESANESSMAGWTSTYGESIGLAPAAATWVLAAHWAGLIVGRAVLSGWLDRAGARPMAVGCAAWAAASAAALVAVPSAIGVTLSAISLGLALSIIFPTILALAGDRYRENAGTVFGWLLAVAQIGGIVFPSLIGVIAEAAGVRAGMLVVVLTTWTLLLVLITATRSR